MTHSYLHATLAIFLITSIFIAKAQINTPCSTSMLSTFTPCLNYITGSSATGSSPTKDCCNSLKSLMTDSMDCVCLIVTGNVPVSIPFLNASLAINLPRVCQNSVPLQCKATGVSLPPSGPVLFGPTPAPARAPAPIGPVSFGPAPAPSSFPVRTTAPPHSHSPKGPVLFGPTPSPSGPIQFGPAPAPSSTAVHTTAHSPHSHSPKASTDVGAVAAAVAPPPVAEFSDLGPAASPPKFQLSPRTNPRIRPVVNPNSASSQYTVELLYLVIVYVGIMAFKFV